MLFISSAGSYKHGIQAEQPNYHPSSGKIMNFSRPYVAEFRKGGVPDWAAEVALTRLRFSGLAYDESPRSRLSVFDTDEAARLGGWTPEFKQQVEEKLEREQSEYYIKVELPRLGRPWRNIDDVRGGAGRGMTRAKQLIATADSVGVSLAEVVAYGKQEGWPAELLAELEAERGQRDSAEPSEELVSA